MIKFLLDVLQIVVLVKLGYSFIKWLLSSKKRHKRSIVNKVWRLLVTNKIHYRLDNALRNQKKEFETTVNAKHAEVTNAKVIPLRKTR